MRARFVIAALTLSTASCALFETFPDLAGTDASALDACDECAAGDADIDDSSTTDGGGLVAYYRGSGADLSGHGNDATWHGNPALSPDRFSTPMLAASFDGTSYFEVSTHPLLPFGHASRTVSLWVRTRHDYSKGAAGSLLSWGLTAPGQRFGLLIAQPGEAYFVGENADVSGGPALNDDRWHNVVVTYDGRLLALFVDLALAMAAVVDLNTVGLALEIGRSTLGHAPEPFTGVIDEIEIFDRVLTSAERRAIYFANGWK